MAKRLRETPGPPQLGHNMHVLRGHDRITFMGAYMKGITLLDAGCGQGAFAIYAKERNFNVWAIDVHDVSDEMDRQGIDFQQVSIEDYNPMMKFDTVVFMEVIEHLEKPEQALEKLYGLLENKGVLLVTTPYVSDWDWEEDHIWRWTLEEFQDMLNSVTKYSVAWSDDIFLYGVMTKEG